MSERTQESVDTAIEQVVGIGESWLRTAGELTRTAIDLTGNSLRATASHLERLGRAVEDAITDPD